MTLYNTVCLYTHTYSLTSGFSNTTQTTERQDEKRCKIEYVRTRTRIYEIHFHSHISTHSITSKTKQNKTKHHQPHPFAKPPKSCSNPSYAHIHVKHLYIHMQHACINMLSTK